MNYSYWIYAKAPGPGFTRLPRKQFDAFCFADGKLNPSLADHDCYISAAVCVVETQYAVPLQVLRAHFPRMRLAKDGSRDLKDAKLEALRHAARMEAARASRHPKRDTKTDSNIIDFSAAVATRRLDDEYEWRPTAVEISKLNHLLDERISKSRETRDRQIVAISAMALDKQIAIATERSSLDWKLDLLSTSPDPMVRAAVAGNRSSPFDVLDRLATDECPEVVLALAGNTNMEGNWLTARAQDPSENVRLAIAANARTPSFVVERMAWSDRSPTVRQAAQAEIDTSTEWSMRAAASEYATEHSLRRAALHRQPEVRRMVVQNPLCSIEILAMLANDPDASVREAVAIRVGVTDSRTLLDKPSSVQPTRQPRQLSLRLPRKRRDP